MWIPDSSADHWIPNPWIWDSTRKTSRILVYARVKLPVLKKWTLQLYVISSVENLFFFLMFLRYLPKENFIDRN